MAPSGGRPKSTMPTMPTHKQAGDYKANAIDLTGLDDSDDDIPVPVGNSSMSGVAMKQQPSGSVSCSKQILDVPPKTAADATANQDDQDASSDDNNLMRAIRKDKYQSPRRYRGEKRKRPPEIDTNAANAITTSVNTNILLNVDRDEWISEKRRRILERKRKEGPRTNAVDSRRQRRQTDGTDNRSEIGSRTRTLRHGIVRRPNHGSTGHIGPVGSRTREPGSEANNVASSEDLVPSKSQRTTAPQGCETQTQGPKSAREASYVSEEDIAIATVQFRKIQEQHGRQRQTTLVDRNLKQIKLTAPSSASQMRLPSHHRPHPQSSHAESSRHRQRPPTPRHFHQPARVEIPRERQPADPGPSRPHVPRVAEPPRPRPNPGVRPGPIKNHEVQYAAAQLQRLKAKLPQQKPTTLIDRFPTESHHPQERRPRDRRASFPTANPEALTSPPDHRATQRRRRIELDVNKQYAHESEFTRARIIEEKYQKYLEGRKAKEAAVRRTRDEEHLTVQGLEATGRAAWSDSEDEEPVQPISAGRVPLSQALANTACEFVTQYVVFASNPHEGCVDDEHVDCLRRRLAFDDLDSANAYAEDLLRGPTRVPQRRKTGARTAAKTRPPPRLQMASCQEIYKNGMMSGLLTLTSGKTICCEVRKEYQATGTLNPNALRRKWAKEEFVQLHRKRYDVWLIKVIPTAFSARETRDQEEEREQAKQREEEEQEERGRKEKTKAEEAVPNEDTAINDEARREQNQKDDIEEIENEGITTALEGEELVAALENLSTPNSSSISGHHHDDTVSEAGSDTSMTSTSTAQPYLPPHRTMSNNADPNPWFHEQYQPILIGSYTDLSHANKKAFDTARVAWKPRTPNMNAWDHYNDEVELVLERERELMDMEKEPAEIVFPPPAYHGHDDHRPWGFVHSRVMVYETVLEGPRDIGAEFVREEKEEGRGENEEGGEPQEVEVDLSAPQTTLGRHDDKCHYDQQVTDQQEEGQEQRQMDTAPPRPSEILLPERDGSAGGGAGQEVDENHAFFSEED